MIITDEESADTDATSDAIANATYLIPAISLASDQATYDDVDVVVRTRHKAGEPEL